jgi:glutamine amidotransferase
MLVIVNYGMGNLGSLRNMFRFIGLEAEVDSSPDRIAQASKIILPGVGNFDAAMKAINKVYGLSEVIKRKALEEKVPLLGICLGMQLLFNSSEEGSLPGLGLVSGKVLRFPNHGSLKVPHMGWNFARLTKGNNPYQQSLFSDARYYFAHSYYAEVANPEDSLMKTIHSVEFDSAVMRGNILGVQFHPEKSHRFGIELLKKFVDL